MVLPSCLYCIFFLEKILMWYEGGSKRKEINSRMQLEEVSETQRLHLLHTILLPTSILRACVHTLSDMQAHVERGRTLALALQREARGRRARTAVSVKE